MASLRIKRRALTLATRGVLSGVAITIATHGLIQIPEIEVPVVEVPAPTGGGTSTISYLVYPEYHKYQSALRLVLDSDTYAKLQAHQPLEIKTEPTGLRGYFDGNGELVVLSESEWQHFDKRRHDDEEVLVLLAAHLFWGEDDV